MPDFERATDDVDSEWTQLVAWYKFDEDNTTPHDTDYGVLGNDIQRGTAGIGDTAEPKYISQNRGAYFDGNDYLELAGIDVLRRKAVSSAFWVNPVGFFGTEMLWTVVASGASGVGVEHFQGDIRMVTTNSCTFAGVLTQNTWSFLGTRHYNSYSTTDTIAELYKDNLLVNTCNLDTIPYYDPTNDKFLVGCDENAAVYNKFFDGFIADFHFWNGVTPLSTFSALTTTTCSTMNAACSLCPSTTSECLNTCTHEEFWNWYIATPVCETCHADCQASNWSCEQPNTGITDWYNNSQYLAYHYKFDRISQILHDTGIWARYHGNLGYTTDTFEIVDPHITGEGQGLYFERDWDDHAQILNFPIFPDLFTIAIWVNIPRNTIMFAKADYSDHNDFFFRIRSSQIQVDLNSPVHTATSVGFGFVANTWMHAAAAIDIPNCEIRFMGNGVFLNTDTGTCTYTDFEGKHVCIMCDWDPIGGVLAPTDHTSGFIADLRIYHGWVTETNILGNIVKNVCVGGCSVCPLNGICQATTAWGNYDAPPEEVCQQCETSITCTDATQATCYECGGMCMTCDQDLFGVITCLSCRPYSQLDTAGNCACYSGFQQVGGKCVRQIVWYKFDYMTQWPYDYSTFEHHGYMGLSDNQLEILDPFIAGQQRGAYFKGEQVISIQMGQYLEPYMERAHTIQFWVKMEDLASRQALFSKTKTDYSQTILISYDTNAIQYEIDSSNTGGVNTFINSGDVSAKLADWTQIVAVYEYLTDVSRLRLFTNNESHPEEYQLSLAKYTDHLDGDISIGAIKTGATTFNTYYSGYITNFQIWQGALDREEIPIELLHTHTVLDPCDDTDGQTCTICPMYNKKCLADCSVDQYYDGTACQDCHLNCNNSVGCAASNNVEALFNCRSCQGPLVTDWVACHKSWLTWSGQAYHDCIGCRRWGTFSNDICECDAEIGNSINEFCNRNVGTYRFITPSEYAYDLSVLAHTGTLGATTTDWDIQNPVYASQNRGLYFDGSAMCVNIADVTPWASGYLINAFTISFFFWHPGTSAAVNSIFLKEQPGPVATTHVYYQNESIAFEILAGATRKITTTTNTLNDDWHHIAAVFEEFDGTFSTMKIYLNGEIDTFDVITLGTAKTDHSNGNMYLGSWDPTIAYTGHIADFQIWQGGFDRQDIHDIVLETGAGWAPMAYCPKYTGTAMRLCASDEYWDGTTWTQCDINCGPLMSCTAAVASCHRCKENWLTCDTNGWLTCRPYYDYSAATKKCTCQTGFRTSLQSQKCYKLWVKYKMDRIGEYQRDVSGNDRWAILGGPDDTIFERTGNYINPDITANQQGLHFAGAQYLSLQHGINIAYDAPLHSSFTIMAWIRHTGTTGVVLGSNDAAGTQILDVGYSASNVAKLRYCAPGCNTFNSNTITNPTDWHHVTWTYEHRGTTRYLRFYIDGQLNSDSDIAITILDSTANELYIGQQFNGATTSNFFTGWIYDFRLYMGTLTGFDVEHMVLQQVGCTATVGTCTVCPKETGICIPHCALAEYYDSGACIACDTNCYGSCQTSNAYTDCMQWHDDCSTCIGNRTDEWIVCRSHFTTNTIIGTVPTNSGYCRCQTGYTKYVDGVTFYCYKLILEYKLEEARHPDVHESYRFQPVATRGLISGVDAADPVPVDSARGFHFDGTQVVVLPTGYALFHDAFTVLYWLRIDPTPLNGIVWSKNSNIYPGSIGLKQEYVNPNLRSTIRNSPTTVTQTDEFFPVQSWRNVAFIYENDTRLNSFWFEIFFDAILQTQLYDPGSFTEQQNDEFTIGNQIIGGVVQAGMEGMVHLFKVFHGPFNSNHLGEFAQTAGCVGDCVFACPSCPADTGSFIDNWDFQWANVGGVCHAWDVGCIYNGTWYAQYEQGCFECYSELCSKCTTKDNFTCEECIPLSGWDPASQTCIVDRGHYIASTRPINIQACHSACRYCHDGTEFDWDACYNNQVIISDGSCGCTSSQFETGNECTNCNPDCLTWDGAAYNNCVTCDVSALRVIVSGACECAIGYYEQPSDGTWAACSPSCHTCYGPTDHDCIECPEGTRYVYGSCIEIECPDGTFEIPSERRCEVWDSQCLTCLGQSEYCTSCENAQYVYVKSENKCRKCQEFDGYKSHKVSAPIIQEYTNTTEVVSQLWDEICGDGINFGQHEWDDGNTLISDGCSDQCIIEVDYKCQGGGTSTADVCSDAVTPQLILSVISGESDSTETTEMKFQLYFNEPVVLKHDLTTADLVVTIQNNPIFTWDIVKITEFSLNTPEILTKQHPKSWFASRNLEEEIQNLYENQQRYELIIYPESDIMDDELVSVELVQPEIVTDNDGNVMFAGEVTTRPATYYYWGSESKDATEMFEGWFKWVVLGLSIIGLILNFSLYSKSAGTEAMYTFWQLSYYMQLISTLLFINTRLPPHLKAFFHAFSWINLVQASEYVGNFLIFTEGQQAPDRFHDEGFSSNFFDSSSGFIFLWFAIIVLYFFVYIVYNGWPDSVWTIAWKRGMVWSLYIRGWEFSIIWITISIFLQLGDMSLVGVDTSFGAIFALATVVIFATAPFALVFLINYKFKKIDKTDTFWRWGALFQEYRFESFWSRNMFVVMIFRRFAWSTGLVYLYSFTFTTIIFLSSATILLVLIIILKQPYKFVVRGTILHTIMEACIIGAVFGFMNLDNATTSSEKVEASWLIIGFVSAGLGVIILFVIFDPICRLVQFETTNVQVQAVQSEIQRGEMPYMFEQTGMPKIREVSRKRRKLYEVDTTAIKD